MLKTFVISLAFLFCLSGLVGSFLFIQKSAEKYCQNVNKFILEQNGKIERIKK